MRRTPDGGSPAPRVSVVGIGNPMAADDGVGVAAAAALAETGLPEGAGVRIAGPDPLALLEELDAGRDVLVLDACRFGGRAGETVLLRLDDPAWADRAAPLSLHGLDLMTVFRLAEALRLPLERAWLLGVEPAGTAAGCGLSPELAGAMPGLLDRARLAVRSLLDGREPADAGLPDHDGPRAASIGAEA